MSRTAVILPPSSASFLVVAGVPLIKRVALSAQRAGFEKVVAMGGRDESALQAVFGGDPRTRGIPIVRGVVADAVDTERVALIPSDVLVTPATLHRVREAECDGRRPLLFHAPGATADGEGILVADRSALAGLNGAPASARTGGAAPPVQVPFDTEIFFPVSDEQTAAAAERELLAELVTVNEETDGPIARFDRRISVRLSRLLVRTPLRPNHITVMGTCLGLTAAWALAQGTYWSGLLGAVLFCVTVIIDGCDGEVARLKFQETRFGGLFDITTDNVVHVAIFVGLGLGQYRAAPDAAYLWLIALLLSGFACASAATYFCLLRHPPVRHLRPRSRRGRLRQLMLAGFEKLMNRDFAYLLLVLAVIGRLGWLLWGAAFGTYLYAAGLVAVYRWRGAE